MTAPATLSSRREFLFCYDIKMGNPNGDPDENRPRVLPDKTHYVTDVRLKRFAHDLFKLQGRPILVDKVEGRTTTLTGRVAAHLQAIGQKEANGAELVNILLDEFIDARLFGSSFAFKPQEGFKLAAEPKTLTGAVQIMHGEVLHKAREVDISGTSVFGSDEEREQGTFTTYFGLRYALIGFNGIANEHSAKVSRMSDADYALLLRAMWDGVRAAGNTRTKRGQVPRLLLNVVYRSGNEFQFGNLADHVKLTARNGKQQEEWSSPDDYTIDVSRLLERLGQQAARIARLEVCLSPDVTLSAPLAVPGVERVDLNFDAPAQGEPMRVVRFRYRGKVGHFLRAEANVDGLTYPVPPPTALLGLAGAVLGLRKDESQEKLDGASFAVAAVGQLPLRFWHRTNVRKDPPAALPSRVRATDRGQTNPKPEKNMRFAQEWLWKPEYRVWAALPESYHKEFAARLAERRWHFTPCLGLAWMFAELDEVEELEAESLPAGVHRVATVTPQEAGTVAMQEAFADGLTLQSLRLSWTVTRGRVFSHRAYWLEIGGKPFSFQTAQAFQCGDTAVVWL